MLTMTTTTVCAQIPYRTEYYCTTVDSEKNKETSIIPLKRNLKKNYVTDEIFFSKKYLKRKKSKTVIFL